MNLTRSKHCYEIQVRSITLCACILFLKYLSHKYIPFQWSFVYKTKSLQAIFQIREDTLPPIPLTLPIKDREKDGMLRILLQKDGALLRCLLHIVACIFVQALSPVRFDQPPNSRSTTLNQENQKLLGNQKSCSGVTDEKPAFTESWPASTDCESSSSSSTASYNMESIARKVKSGKTTISSERRNWHELSDLTKYVLFYNIHTRPTVIP